jgi:hypothetical protein
MVAISHLNRGRRSSPTRGRSASWLECSTCGQVTNGFRWEAIDLKKATLTVCGSLKH